MIKTTPDIKRDLNLKRLAGFVTAIAMLFMPFTANALFGNEIKLQASDGAASDFFGWSVSISGDTAIIGARADDDNGIDSGSAYILVRDAAGAWTQQKKLLASDGAADDWFGWSVSISGDTAIVGAPRDGDNGSGSGSAYIFVRDPATDTWTQQRKLLAADGAAGDNFGYSVSISGNTAIIGAYGDGGNGVGENGVDSGSAYVFVRNTTGFWSLQQYLVGSWGGVSDAFGYSVAVSGDTLIVGSPRDDDNGGDSGSAYVFIRVGNNWTLQQNLIAPDGAAADQFGDSVSVSGDTVIVGAYWHDDNGSQSGSAYVFVSAAGVWTPQQKLTAPDGWADDWFGGSVSVSGDMAIIGAHRDDDKGSGSGSAYAFVRDPDTGAWTNQKLTASDGASNDFFGTSVSISGDTVIIGARTNDNSAVDSGAAYVYLEPNPPSPPLPPPTQAEVSVRAIEVTQAVQDWNNSVTLIAGKVTVVRAFVELLPGNTPRTIAVRLYGTRGSQALPGSPIFPVNNRVVIDTDITSRRGNLPDSFNFRLPSSWTNGNINLRLVLVDLSGDEMLTDCNEPGVASSDCAVSVGFPAPVGSLSVKFFGISWLDTWTPAGSSTPSSVTRSAKREHVLEQLARIESIYPLARVNSSFGTMPPYTSGTAPKLGDVNVALRTQWALDLANCLFQCVPDSRYYGVLLSGTDSGTGRAVGVVASGFVTRSQAGRDGVGYVRNRSVHELSHTSGISHTVDPNIPASNKGTQFGSCTSSAPSGAAVFPNHALLQIDANRDGASDSGGERAPVIGPLDAGVDSEIWGFDTRYLQDNVNDLAVIDPNVTTPMMSYCWDGEPQGRWPSAFNYERLVGDLPPGTTGAYGTYLFAIGYLSAADGSIVRNMPIIEVSGTPVLPTAGTYRVALNDAAGTELVAVDFEPVAGEMVDAAGPGEATGGQQQQQLFFTVPLLKPTVPIAEVIISNNGVEISRIVASPNSPSVTITQPVAGQNLATELVTLAWTGADADGDALTYTVQYSSDGGSTWESLAVNTAVESYELERAYLSASTDARIRVAVSDGVNTSVTTSDPFTVANNGPLVLIKQPRAGLSFADGQTVIFEAFAYDTEDSSIGDAAISWESDIDGSLGTGRELILNTLTTGLHTVTVTATDSAGAPSTDSIVLGIGVPLPDITAADAITPVNDQQIPFAGLTVGGSSDQTVTLSNDGNADLVIGGIAQANVLTAPFSLVNDTCSGQTVVAMTSCSFDIRFAPTAVGVFSDSFDIPSNDPDENPLTVSVSGTGLAIVNIPPSSPVLVSPTNGQQGLASSVTLEWRPATDADGDTVSYDVYNCTDGDPVNNCTLQAQVASLDKGLDNGVYLASLGLGGGTMILGITFVGGTRSRRQTVLLIAAIVLSSLLVSCDGGGGDDGGAAAVNDNKTYTVSNLATATTYYWVIVAKDGKGGETSSAVESYSTQ